MPATLTTLQQTALPYDTMGFMAAVSLALWRMSSADERSISSSSLPCLPVSCAGWVWPARPWTDAGQVRNSEADEQG